MRHWPDCAWEYASCSSVDPSGEHVVPVIGAVQLAVRNRTTPPVGEEGINGLKISRWLRSRERSPLPSVWIDVWREPFTEYPESAVLVTSRQPKRLTWT